MTDFLRRGSIIFKAKALLSVCVKSIKIFKANRERTLLEIPSGFRALLYNNRLRILLIFSLIIFGFIYKALLSYNGLIRFNKISDNKEKNFLIRILVRI
jgi:hypothetical protein